MYAIENYLFGFIVGKVSKKKKSSLLGFDLDMPKMGRKPKYYKTRAEAEEAYGRLSFPQQLAMRVIAVKEV